MPPPLFLLLFPLCNGGRRCGVTLSIFFGPAFLCDHFFGFCFAAPRGVLSLETALFRKCITLQSSRILKWLPSSFLPAASTGSLRKELFPDYFFAPSPKFFRGFDPRFTSSIVLTVVGLVRRNDFFFNFYLASVCFHLFFFPASAPISWTYQCRVRKLYIFVLANTPF